MDGTWPPLVRNAQDGQIPCCLSGALALEGVPWQMLKPQVHTSNFRRGMNYEESPRKPPDSQTVNSPSKRKNINFLAVLNFSAYIRYSRTVIRGILNRNQCLNQKEGL